MELNKIVGISFLSFFSGFGAYLYFQKKKIDRVLKKLKINVKGIHNLAIVGNNLTADLYLTAANPTNESVSLNTGAIQLNELRVFDKKNGKKIGISDLHLNEIVLSAHGNYDFPKLGVSIPLIVGAEIALAQLFKQKQDFLKRLRFELDITAGNLTKTISFNG